MGTPVVRVLLPLLAALPLLLRVPRAAPRVRTPQEVAKLLVLPLLGLHAHTSLPPVLLAVLVVGAHWPLGALALTTVEWLLGWTVALWALRLLHLLFAPWLAPYTGRLWPGARLQAAEKRQEQRVLAVLPLARLPPLGHPFVHLLAPPVAPLDVGSMNLAWRSTGVFPALLLRAHRLPPHALFRKLQRNALPLLPRHPVPVAPPLALLVNGAHE